jgi:hypothetical protein
MAKDYIRDEGRVRMCDSNIIIWYRKFFYDDLRYNIWECLKTIWEGLLGFAVLFFHIILMILFPISFPYVAYRRIAWSKEQCERREKGRPIQ